MVTFEFEYKFSNDFKRWLKENKPNAARVLEELGVDSASVTADMNRFGDNTRFKLTFRGLHFDASEDFDCRTDIEEACIVLDKHPERLARETDPSPLPIKSLESLVKPVICLADAELVRRATSHPYIGIPIVIRGREAYLLKCETLDGLEFMLDMDEIRASGAPLRSWPQGRKLPTLSV